MFNSFINFIGTPVAPTTPGANVTIEESNLASNSTAVDFDGIADNGSHYISSPSVSPVKETRENSMSSKCTWLLNNLDRVPGEVAEQAFLLNSSDWQSWTPSTLHTRSLEVKV